MPKDEFDFEDPMELNGVGIVCQEDTTEAMTECFVEEFMRLGHNHKQILALFRNPHYLGMNLVVKKRGEAFVQDKIIEVFMRWGRVVSWSSAPTEADTRFVEDPTGLKESATEPHSPILTDPMGAPMPKMDI
jgi:hypothetical protein